MSDYLGEIYLGESGQAVSGRNYWQSFDGWYSPTAMRDELERGEIVTCTDVRITNNVVVGHIRAVLDVFEDDGVWMVKLYDPAGYDSGSSGFIIDGVNDGFMTMTFDQFKAKMPAYASTY
jgi:hypothetical protein